LALHGTRQECESLLIFRGREGIELRSQFGDGSIPGDRLKFSRAAVAGPFHRLCNAIGMIRHLDGGLPAHAQFAMADRMCGIAFELLRQAHFDQAGLTIADDFGFALHDSNEYSAA
jgi:hypothetical protein